LRAVKLRRLSEIISGPTTPIQPAREIETRGFGPDDVQAGADAMSAFQAYAGLYEAGGVLYQWRCYATARVYEIRESAHGPLPPPPAGKKWCAQIEGRCAPPGLRWLVDHATDEFSQILVQIQPEPRRATGRAAPGPALSGRHAEASA
jgi:hypothetical protein